jgi:hypothetical protein
MYFQQLFYNKRVLDLESGNLNFSFSSAGSNVIRGKPLKTVSIVRVT